MGPRRLFPPAVDTGLSSERKSNHVGLASAAVHLKRARGGDRRRRCTSTRSIAWLRRCIPMRAPVVLGRVPSAEDAPATLPVRARSGIDPGPYSRRATVGNGAGPDL